MLLRLSHVTIQERVRLLNPFPGIFPTHQMFDHQLDSDALWEGLASQTGGAPSPWALPADGRIQESLMLVGSHVFSAQEWVRADAMVLCFVSTHPPHCSVLPLSDIFSHPRMPPSASTLSHQTWLHAQPLLPGRLAHSAPMTA